MSKTSSRNPSIVAISSERREDRYTDNYVGSSPRISCMKERAHYSLDDEVTRPQRDLHATYFHAHEKAGWQGNLRRETG
jgi:hypothetical protein